jgi:hypothetical protein
MKKDGEYMKLHLHFPIPLRGELDEQNDNYSLHSRSSRGPALHLLATLLDIL